MTAADLDNDDLDNADLDHDDLADDVLDADDPYPTEGLVPLDEWLVEIDELERLGDAAPADREEDPFEASLVQAADDVASDAAFACVIARGLVESVERLRVTHPTDVAPAPGLVETLDEVQRLAREAVDDVMGAQFVARAVYRTAHERERAATTFLEEVERTRVAVWRHLRRLAQLAIGIAWHHDWDEAWELVERAAVFVLGHAPARAADDDPPIAGRTREEVTVELVGLIARLHVEPPPTPDGAHEFTVRADGVDDVVVTIRPQVGITVDDTELPDARWPDVAALVMSRLAATDPTAVERVTIVWSGS